MSDLIEKGLKGPIAPYLLTRQLHERPDREGIESPMTMATMTLRTRYMSDLIEKGLKGPLRGGFANLDSYMSDLIEKGFKARSWLYASMKRGYMSDLIEKGLKACRGSCSCFRCRVT